MLKGKFPKIYKYILGVGIGLLVASIILSFWQSWWLSLKMVFGSFYVLFLPGLVLSYAFFSSLDIFERIALSFALSISSVSLMVFYANLLGIKIKLFNVLWEVALIIVVGLAVIYWRAWRRKT